MKLHYLIHVSNGEGMGYSYRPACDPNRKNHNKYMHHIPEFVTCLSCKYSKVFTQEMRKKGRKK